MNLNVGLVNALKNGAGLSSPVTAVISTAQVKASAVLGAVQSGALSALGVDKVEALESQILSAQGQMNGFAGHAAQQLASALDLGSQAQTLKRATATLEGLPPSCDFTNNILGSITDIGVGLMNGLGDALDFVLDLIDQYLLGLLPISEILAVIDDALSAIGSAISSIADRIALELQLAEDMLKEMATIAISMALDSLWSDPCGGAVLKQLVSDELKEHLPVLSI